VTASRCPVFKHPESRSKAGRASEGSVTQPRTSRRTRQQVAGCLPSRWSREANRLPDEVAHPGREQLLLSAPREGRFCHQTKGTLIPAFESPGWLLNGKVSSCRSGFPPPTAFSYSLQSNFTACPSGRSLHANPFQACFHLPRALPRREGEQQGSLEPRRRPCAGRATLPRKKEPLATLSSSSLKGCP